MQAITLLEEETIKDDSFDPSLHLLPAKDGDDIVSLTQYYDHDLIILGLRLGYGSEDGFQILRRIRQNQIKTPILIISSLNDIHHKLRAFQLGADDYVTTPFALEELQARIKALYRRYQQNPSQQIKAGKLTIDLDLRQVYVEDQPIHLTKKEYDIVEFLALRKSRILTKEMILEHLYRAPDKEPDLKIIDVFICKIRKKISQATGGPTYIHTEWGRGFTMKDPPDEDRQSRPPQQTTRGPGRPQQHSPIYPIGSP